MSTIEQLVNKLKLIQMAAMEPNADCPPHAIGVDRETYMEIVAATAYLSPCRTNETMLEVGIPNVQLLNTYWYEEEDGNIP